MAADILSGRVQREENDDYIRVCTAWRRHRPPENNIINLIDSMRVYSMYHNRRWYTRISFYALYSSCVCVCVCVNRLSGKWRKKTRKDNYRAPTYTVRRVHTHKRKSPIFRTIVVYIRALLYMFISRVFHPVFISDRVFSCIYTIAVAAMVAYQVKSSYEITAPDIETATTRIICKKGFVPYIT